MGFEDAYFAAEQMIMSAAQSRERAKRKVDIRKAVYMNRAYSLLL